MNHKEKTIKDHIFNSIFINNPNIIAKLISDITKIPYSKLKNNIFINTNEIQINNKQEKLKNYDFIVKLNNKTIINKKLNTKKYEGLKTKNTSYSFNLYSNNTKNNNHYYNNFLIIQINLNTFSNKNTKYIDIFELRNKEGTKYIDNFKIITLDIVKCHKLYYDNLKTNNNTIKWGAFLYNIIKENNKTNKLTNIELNNIKSELNKLNIDNYKT